MADSPLRIVVLDGYTLNPGDLSWEGLERLGNCTIYDRTPPEETVSRAEGCPIVLTNKTILSQEVIQQLPEMKYVGVTSTGYNVVDLVATRERDIPVTNVPTYGTNSVAQAVFAHLLNLTQRFADHAQTVRDGRWTECIDFCYWDHPLIELSGLTMGIVGFGRIGQATGHLANAFGMRVLAYDAFKISPPGFDHQIVDVETIFRESDVISLHCPLTDDNLGMVNHDRLTLMKNTAFLINTSRGPLVNQQDLAAALNEGRIAGAGLDVLEVEPPPADNPLFKAKNCYITPHIAWATRSSRGRLLQTVVDNVQSFLDGKTENVVNP